MFKFDFSTLIATDIRNYIISCFSVRVCESIKISRLKRDRRNKGNKGKRIWERISENKEYNFVRSREGMGKRTNFSKDLILAA